MLLCIAIALITWMGSAHFTNSSAHPTFNTVATPNPVATPLTTDRSGLSTVTDPTPITHPAASPAFFGMTVIHYPTPMPQFTFGTTRTWDAYPSMDWAAANPAPGQYNFAPLNAFIKANPGREIVYTFGKTPQWASTSPAAPGPFGSGRCAPPTISAWDQYVTEVVINSAGRIKYWELWNEPDQKASYCSDLSSLVVMAQHAYAIIRKIDPSAMVLSPSATGEAGAAWFKSFLKAGGLHTFDIVAFHGYEGTKAERINAVVDDFRRVMSRNNLGALPLWDTECSWGNTDIGDDAHRAAFLSKYFFLQWSKGVDRVLWYAYDANPEWGRLIDANGNSLPSGRAYGETYKWIVGAILTQPCAQDKSGTWTCSISRSGGYQAQIHLELHGKWHHRR